LFACSGKAQAASVVRARTAPANRDEVSFGKDVIKSNSDVREGITVSRMERLEIFRSVHIGSQTMHKTMACEHLVDRVCAALVPRLPQPTGEPAPCFRWTLLPPCWDSSLS